jgi:elongation factor Ts
LFNCHTVIFDVLLLQQTNLTVILLQFTRQAIYRKQLEAENKPAEMIEKILPGKLEKYYSEVCLLKQKYVKDDSMTVEQYLKQNNAELASFIYIKI